MYLKSLYYFDKDVNWKLVNMTFEPFTLIVGLSGVGKSRILSAILGIKDIICGKTALLSGVEWEIAFSTPSGDYIWKGAFKSLNKHNPKFPCKEQDLYIYESALNNDNLPCIDRESLFFNGNEIFCRQEGINRFRGNNIPSVTIKKSFVEIFENDPQIDDVLKAFSRIFSMEFRSDKNIFVEMSQAKTFEDKQNGPAFNDIVTSNLPLISKLAYIFLREKDIFNIIRTKFLDIFPHVEDITFKEGYCGRYFALCIKEKSTDYIIQNNLSSGMYKSLMFITQLNLMAGNCVVLIDEIENSLGLNCIDILHEELAAQNMDDQYIITSHHPYVINNIDMKYWRILSRSGGIVTTRSAEDLKLGYSSHESYMQLINALEYSEGIK